MAVNFADAINAYQKIARRDSLPGMDSRKTGDSGDFAEVLRAATQDAVGALHDGERQSIAAAAGTADLNDVVTAVGKAELTLQTVVTLRDRVIQAYQEVLRMPI